MQQRMNERRSGVKRQHDPQRSGIHIQTKVEGSDGLARDHDPMESINCKIGDNTCAAKHVSVIQNRRLFHPMNEAQRVTSMYRLQQQYGNRFARKVIAGNTVQMKLRIGQPDETYEKESNLMADQVTRTPEPRGQRQPLEEEDELVQSKRITGIETEGTPLLEAQIQSLKRRGEPLPETERAFFEPRFGYDFGRVRVHTDVKSSETAKMLNARAFTTGREVVFGAGQYSPGSEKGRKLLAHELTHVLQQRAVSGPKINRLNERNTLAEVRGNSTGSKKYYAMRKEESVKERNRTITRPPMSFISSLPLISIPSWMPSIKIEKLRKIFEDLTRLKPAARRASVPKGVSKRRRRLIIKYKEERMPQRREIIAKIREARRIIRSLDVSDFGGDRQEMKKAKARYYRKLNTFTPYYGQFPNLNILRKYSRKKKRWYSAGGRTCNVTSLAMALTGLGVNASDFLGDRNLLTLIAHRQDERFTSFHMLQNERMPDFLQFVAIYIKFVQLNVLPLVQRHSSIFLQILQYIDKAIDFATAAAILSLSEIFPGIPKRASSLAKRALRVFPLLNTLSIFPLFLLDEFLEDFQNVLHQVLICLRDTIIPKFDYHWRKARKKAAKGVLGYEFLQQMAKWFGVAATTKWTPMTRSKGESKKWVFTKFYKNWLLKNILPLLKSGKQIFAFRKRPLRHFVRLQDIDKRGIVVDDPGRIGRENMLIRWKKQGVKLQEGLFTLFVILGKKHKK
jgi:hypothetical protein